MTLTATLAPTPFPELTDLFGDAVPAVPATPAVSYLDAVPDLRRRTGLVLGLDLTGAGVAPARHRRTTAPVQRLALGDLADYVQLAQTAGIDLVVLGESFRLDDAARSDSWLDPAVAASRLAAAGLLAGRTHVVPALPAGYLDPLRLARAIGALQDRSGGRAGWQVPIFPTADGVHAEIRRAWHARTERHGGTTPLLVTAPREASDAVVVGNHSDVVRLDVRSRAEAIARRRAVRTAAERAGRDPEDVRVLVDARCVIGEDSASAQFRADLLRDLDADLDPLTFAGTGQDVAQELHDWAEAGAADGFVLTPGSLRSDVTAIVRELAPALDSRGPSLAARLP